MNLFYEKLEKYCGGGGVGVVIAMSIVVATVVR